MTTYEVTLDTPQPEQAAPHAELLQNMYAAIDTAFDELWSARYQSPLDTPEEVAEEREEALAHEHAFADKVFSRTTEVAARTGKPTTVLLDIDETFVKKVYTPDDKMVDQVRPAFVPLIRALDEVLGDQFSIGILTTRGQSHLDAELQSPTFLAAVQDKVDPRYVLSVRSGSPADEKFPGRVYDTHAGAREKLGDFLNPELIFDDEMDTLDATRKVTRSRVGWASSKLPVVKDLADSHPDHAFVYVDDAAGASVINPQYSPNLAAIQVYDDAAFWGIK